MSGDKEKKKIEDSIRSVLGSVREFDLNIYADLTVLTFTRGANIGYDVLLSLSNALGTTDINFEYDAGHPYYSEMTPGDPASFCVTIRGISPLA